MHDFSLKKRKGVANVANRGVIMKGRVEEGLTKRGGLTRKAQKREKEALASVPEDV